MKKKQSPVFQNVMADLETLGRRAGCRIMSIGAVEFSADGLGRSFYTAVGIKGQENLFTDQETLAWWEKQSAEARQALTDHQTSVISLEQALATFNDFLIPLGQRNVKVWGNGSDFDNAILYACYAEAGLKPAWEFWNSRCYRTLKNIAPHVKKLSSVVAHNALEDAKDQAEHAVEILRLARSVGVEL